MFFILSSPRSGSTLLKEVLNLNTRIYCLNETDFIPLTAQVIENVSDENQGKDIICKIISSSNFSASLTQFLSNKKIYKLIHQSEYDLSSIMTSLYQEVLEITGAEVVGDKSPNNLPSLHLLKLQGLFDKNIKYIHIVRDLRDVLLSIKKMSWAPKDLNEFSESWAKNNIEMSDIGLLYPDKYLFVRYEDFLLDPKLILHKCCDFLGVEYDPSMMDWAKCKKDFHDPSIHQNIGLPPLTNKIEIWRNGLLNDPELFDYAFPGIEALKFYGYSFE